MINKLFSAAQLSAVNRSIVNNFKRMMSAEAASAKSASFPKYQTLALSTPKPFVVHVELNRPDKLNAFNHEMWLEIHKCFDNLAMSPDCRAIVVSGAGKHFTAGIDLVSMMKKGQELAAHDDVARKANVLEVMIKEYQDAISALELCPKPIICAIHSACIGAGVDLTVTADIRYCTQDAFFQIKEVDIGLAADVGSLQRLPKAIGSESLARELCFTGRRFKSDEALRWGFVNQVFADRQETLNHALSVAELIAQKSPVAVQATKQNLVYSRSRPNQEGLDHVRLLNKLNLQSEDFANAVTAGLTKGEIPVFSKL